MADGLDSTIHEIYGAATGTLPWSTALTNLTTAVGGRAMLVSPLSVGARVVRLHTPNLADEIDVYFADWRSFDIRADAAIRRTPTEEILTERTLRITDRAKSRSPFYQEYLRSLGFSAFAAFTFALPNGEQHALSIQRELGRGDFDEEELRRLSVLGRHFARAVGITDLVDRLTATAAATATATATAGLGHGLVFLDEETRVIEIDPVAERLLGRAFALRGRRLAGLSRRTAPLVERFLDGLYRDGGRSGDPLLLPAEPRHGPVLVQALPIDGRPVVSELRGGGSHCRMVIAVSELDPRRDLDLGRLLTGRGLTPNEARIAAELGFGASPRIVAERFALSEQTVRHVAKSIYRKLDLAKQSELAAYVTRVAAALVEPPSVIGSVAAAR